VAGVVPLVPTTKGVPLLMVAPRVMSGAAVELEFALRVGQQ